MTFYISHTQLHHLQMGYGPSTQPARRNICQPHFIQTLFLFLSFINASTTVSSPSTSKTYNTMFLSSSFRQRFLLLLLPRCCHPCRSGHTVVSLSSSSSSSSPTTSSTSKNHKLSDTLHSLLRQRLTPVQRIDTHAARFLQKPAFRDFVIKRYDLLSLEAQGEESAIRRVVHAYLLVNDEFYRQLLTTLASLPDPWEGKNNGGEGEGQSEKPSSSSSYLFFQPIEEKIYTSSKRKSHLVAALTGRTSTSKAVSQLSANVASLLEKNRDEGNSSTDLINERKGRLEEMESKLRRFESLVEVLSAIEARLSKARDEVLTGRRRRWRQAQAQGQGQDSSSSSSEFSSSPTIDHDTNAWGKAVEKEGKQALKACITELQQKTSLPSPLLLLTSVTMQSLATDDMAKLRTHILQTHTHYQGLEWPKAELDALIVSPSPEAPQVLRVLLAIEMKRSLDEVAVDCLRFSLLLEMCRRAPPGALKFSSSSSSSSSGGGKKKVSNNNNNKRTKEGGEWSTAGGYVLDFSSLRLPQDAIYLTKRGGATLRATSKLMLEQVQLQREDEKENENNDSARVSDRENDTNTSTTLLSRFYAPDFVDVDGEGDADAKIAAADREREAVVDMLLARFRTHGYKRLQKRLGNVVQVLTGQALSSAKEEEEGEEEGPSPALTTVFTLKNK